MRTDRSVHALVVVTMVALPSVAVGRFLDHQGFGGWTQFAGQFVTTWVCLLVLLRRDLAIMLRRQPPEPPHTSTERDSESPRA